MSFAMKIQTQHGLTIEAVENGFIVRSINSFEANNWSGGFPCRVAETPEKLAEILMDWARARMTPEPVAGASSALA